MEYDRGEELTRPIDGLDGGKSSDWSRVTGCHCRVLRVLELPEYRAAWQLSGRPPIGHTGGYRWRNTVGPAQGHSPGSYTVI